MRLRNLTLAGSLVALAAVALTGCSGPRSTAEAGRERARFLELHGDRLTPYQSSLIRRLPYSRSDQSARMAGILEGAEHPPGVASGRRSVLGFQDESLRGSKGVRVIDLGPEIVDEKRAGSSGSGVSDSGERIKGNDSGEDQLP